MSNPNKKSEASPHFLLVIGLVMTVVGVVLIAVSAVMTPPAGQHDASSIVVKTKEDPISSYSYKPSNSPGCFQKVYFLEVAAGKSVWSAISGQVWKNYPSMTAEQHEGVVADLVAFMQSQIDLSPGQTVRNLNVVPVGYRFGITADNGILLPGDGLGQAF